MHWMITVMDEYGLDGKHKRGLVEKKRRRVGGQRGRGAYAASRAMPDSIKQRVKIRIGATYLQPQQQMG